ncbi:MAG: J domain-containing protein [Thalassobaculaceae bacterium]|nr:J domain-containing protein [Thalassobaculaceae bacterium]
MPCSSAFRDAVLRLAEKRHASPSDLARAVLLLIPRDILARTVDPGGPGPEDREHVALQSGASRGRVLKRKPRLQMRLPAGYAHGDLRRALALALSMSKGEAELAVVTAADRKAEAAVERARDEMADENTTLRGLVADLAMPVLPRGIQTRSEALFALGFPPTAVPDNGSIRRRWRRMAMIYHPDSAFGDHDRMSQLNQALEKLTQ